MRSVPSDRVVELNGFITSLVKTIVDHPEGVSVHVIPTSHRIIVELHTDASDVGQVVGSGGRVVSAVRTLLGAYGGKHRFKVDLDYVTEKNNLAPFRD
jgi:predicted RNA-binding protein YlqC (UPF0109 family)